MSSFSPEQLSAPPSAATAAAQLLLSSARKEATTSSPLGPPRGVVTPPPPSATAAVAPQRPRLFARSNMARVSPPPPARLAPILNSLTEEEAGRLSEAWPPSLVQEATARPPMSAPHGPHDGALPRVGSGAAAATVVEPCLSRQPRRASPLPVPPEDAVADAWCAAQCAAATASGASLIHSVGTSKRHRMVSSADTQHSLTSSTLPPPRTRRALGQPSAAANSCGLTSPTLSLRVSEEREVDNEEEDEDDGAAVHGGGGRRLRGSSAGSSCNNSTSSRGAISYSASSVHLGGSGVAQAGAVEAVTPPAMQRRRDGRRHSGSLGVGCGDGGAAAGRSAMVNVAGAADAQCLVFDDSVDAAAVVTPAQLQQLRLEAASRGPSTCSSGAGGRLSEEVVEPYQGRLITAEVLRDWTGWEDLELVLATQLRLDADAMIGVDQIGAQLPRLTSLKLNSSRIPRLRQLGTGFYALKYLWLNSCHLADVRGIASCCPSLVELYLPFNYVSDLSPIMGLSATLKVLDVEGNLLDDAVALGSVLAALRGVRSLSLLGNPLTCEHQGRVRAALAKEEDEARERSKAADTAGVDSRAAPEEQPVAVDGDARVPFSRVLARWVHLVMPELQTLNDAPIEEALDASAVSCATPLVLVPSSVHVDPLDDALAEELQLVEALVRETDAFDPLLAAVDAANGSAYTRPSTSCSGARPRLAPATAMGVTRPSTSSLWARGPVRLGSAASSATDASSLTTGLLLAGSATASLRRRIASPSLPSTPPVGATAAAVGECGLPAAGGTLRISCTPLSNRYDSDPGMCLATATHRSASLGEVDEEARIAALLADDSEEEEWENFKSALLLRSHAASASASATGAADVTSMSPLDRQRRLSCVSDEEDEEAAAAAAPCDNFDKELRTELSRLRMRMARAARE